METPTEGGGESPLGSLLSSDAVFQEERRGEGGRVALGGDVVDIGQVPPPPPPPPPKH